MADDGADHVAEAIAELCDALAGAGGDEDAVILHAGHPGVAQVVERGAPGGELVGEVWSVCCSEVRDWGVGFGRLVCRGQVVDLVEDDERGLSVTGGTRRKRVTKARGACLSACLTSAAVGVGCAGVGEVGGGVGSIEAGVGIGAADMSEGFLNDAYLIFEGGVGDVDHVEKDICFADFVEGGSEGLDEMVWKLADEAYGITEKERDSAVEGDLADGGVKSGEESVLGEDIALAKEVH